MRVCRRVCACVSAGGGVRACELGGVRRVLEFTPSSLRNAHQVDGLVVRARCDTTGEAPNFVKFVYRFRILRLQYNMHFEKQLSLW